jgi:prepilin-type processing-associated H-X9-DG protein
MPLLGCHRSRYFETCAGRNTGGLGVPRPVAPETHSFSLRSPHRAGTIGRGGESEFSGLERCVTMAIEPAQRSNEFSYELPRSRKSVGSKSFKAVTIILGTLLFLIISLAFGLPCGGGMFSRRTADRAMSASNMHQIGLALIMYSNGDSLGRFSPDLPTLITSQQLSPNVFVSPSLNDTPAPGNTLAEQAANLMTGGHESYTYVGATLTNQSPSNAVTLYEPLSANKNTGSNVLFADGHTEFLPQPVMEQIIQMAQSGVRPIYWPPHPATQPSAQP